MPAAHRFGGLAVAHEHGVHRGAEEALDEHGPGLVGRQEVAQRAEHRALAELLALAQQAGGGGSEPHAFALQPLEGVHLSVEGGDRLFQPGQVAPGLDVALAGGAVGVARRLQLGVGGRGLGTGRFEGGGCSLEFALGRGERVGERDALPLQRRALLRGLIQFALAALAVEVEVAGAVLHFTQGLLGPLGRGARGGHGFTAPVFAALAVGELGFERPQ